MSLFISQIVQKFDYAAGDALSEDFSNFIPFSFLKLLRGMHYNRSYTTFSMTLNIRD